MTTLFVLCEGQSEELFVKRVLSPYLLIKQIYPIPTIVTTKRMREGEDFKGGVKTWGKVKVDLKLLLKNSHAFVTTLIDYYGLPEDTPKPRILNIDATQQALAIEQAIKEDLQINGLNVTRFIPFLSVHELEAWVFSVG